MHHLKLHHRVIDTTTGLPGLVIAADHFRDGVPVVDVYIPGISILQDVPEDRFAPDGALPRPPMTVAALILWLLATTSVAVLLATIAQRTG